MRRIRTIFGMRLSLFALLCVCWLSLALIPGREFHTEAWQSWRECHGLYRGIALFSIVGMYVLTAFWALGSMLLAHVFLNDLTGRRFGPIALPPLPRIEPDEPPGGAPVFARLGPRKPAPLAAHALPRCDDSTDETSELRVVDC